MSEISTNTILDGITLTLRAAYPDHRIESHAIEQGLRPPAFIVLLFSAGKAARPGRRWRRTPRFDIVYFPQNGREECYKVADELCQVLEVITLSTGDALRGSNMDFEVIDGVLHFFVSYNHFVYRDSEEEAMGSLKIEQGGN